MGLWDEGFVGWPASEKRPVGREGIGELAEAVFDEVRSTEFHYELTPLAVTVYDEIGVIFYLAETIYEDRAGEGSTEVSRLTHVWRHRDGEWTIIGGMSAPADTVEANQ